MSSNAKILSLFFSVFISGCASTYYDVKSDYNQDIDYAVYKTFKWLPSNEKEISNSLASQRVIDAVERELKEKNIERTENDPDFLIVKYLGKKGKVSVTDLGYSYGSYSGYNRVYGGISTYEYDEGSLILDFVDPKSKNIVWRGSVKAEVQNINTPEKSETLINSAVKAVLDNYPPKKSLQ